MTLTYCQHTTENRRFYDNGNVNVCPCGYVAVCELDRVNISGANEMKVLWLENLQSTTYYIHLLLKYTNVFKKNNCGACCG